MNPFRLILPGACFNGFRGCRIGLLAILLRLATIQVEGASGDYLIDVWRGESGLPSSSVTAIAQTPNGYLWAGTYNGLARFDGVRFVKFDPDNTPELKRARVRKLYLDQTGTLWINTYDGSLTSFRDGHFKLEWTGDNSFDSTAVLVSGRSNHVAFLLHTGELISRTSDTTNGTDTTTNGWRILRPPGASSGSLCVEDGSGVLWGRGRDQKLWRYRGDAFELMPTNSGLPGNISCLVTDSKGQLWAGTDKEVARWDGTRFESMTPTNGEPTLNVSALYVAPGGDIWIVANQRVRKAQGRQWVFEAEPCRGLFSGSQERLGMLEDRAGSVWLYHYGRGLFHIRHDGVTRQLDLEDNFPGDRVDGFYEDHEGNLWCGVDRGGLVRLRQKRFVALIPADTRAAPPATAAAEEGAADNVIVPRSTARGAARAAVSVAEDAQGAIWIGSYGGGLHRWFDGQWQHYSVLDRSRRSFVFSVCPDAQSRLWVSAGEEDLFLGTEGRFEAVTPAVHGVKALLAGRDGRVWIGNKSGLWVWNKGQTRQFRSEDGIRRTDVRALAEDPSGAIWAGAGDGVLYRIVSNRVESLQIGDSLAGQPIWSLYADSQGTLWIGTFRGGLLRFQGGKFNRYTTRDGLPDDVICQILEDGNGRLWIGCQQGIFSVAKSDLATHLLNRDKALSCTTYGRYDGLPSLECSGGYQPAAWRTRDGRLLFSTLGGAVSVQPEELAPNNLPPPVAIEEVLVDGTNVQSQVSTRPKVQSPGGEVLEVEPGKRQLEFRYTGLSFVSPDRVRFRYRLDGLEKDYIEAGTRRYAQYSFLRPGDYTFRVSACNNDGVWNEQTAAISLRVLPHFYETWWFRAGAWIASFGLLAVAVRQVVVRRMQRKLRDLERQQAVERDRARIAQDIHDDLGAGLTQIMLLSELARREPSQDVPGQLGQISEMARGLTRTMDEIVWAVDPQHDTLSGFMDYASVFAEEFLRVAQLRCRMDLPTALPDVAMDAELRYNLFLALKEALNNAVKHARASEVRLGLRLKDQSFTLVVQDNGQGLPAVSGSVNGNGNGHGGRMVSGHGLLNLEKRLRSVGGQCVVYSGKGEGTRVEMTVRVKNGASPIVATVHAKPAV